MKDEWRKKEKDIYIPKQKPEVVEVPEYKFLTISGEGNPASELFQECIGALYSVSYSIKMTLKKESNVEGYNDYTVYPLEGIWDIKESAREHFNGTINKDDLVFKLMIRQPSFVTDEFIDKMIQYSKNKKSNEMLDLVKIEKITDGKCIQMLHLGSYDNETESFNIMEEFAKAEGLTRESKVHREIYLSDFRKVETDKLKTVLRFRLNP